MSRVGIKGFTGLESGKVGIGNSPERQKESIQDRVETLENNPVGGGEPGPPGDSAYQVWLDLGNVGTETDFINSLQGADGADGVGVPAAGTAGQILVKASDNDYETQWESLSVDMNEINATGELNSSVFLRADGVWAAPTAASEWTRVVLGSDFSTTNATNTNITGLSFTPTPGRVYYIEIYLLLRTATATVGARPGIAFPTNLLDSGAWMQAPNSATASAQRWWGTTGTANAASTGLGNTTDSWMAIGGAMLVCSPSTTGNFQITLASETAGTAVTAKRYSFLRYREI